MFQLPLRISVKLVESEKGGGSFGRTVALKNERVTIAGAEFALKISGL
jgi:hypothetical protein